MTIDVQTLIDLAVEHNMAPSSYFTQWDVYADWQMDVLKRQGLSPEHRLLDVGCGALRLGLVAIPYLDSGNYFGIDPNDRLLTLGKTILQKAQIERPHTLSCSGAFDFERFGTTFHYAMAQSVLTHLSQPEIAQCLTQLKLVMNPGGKFVFTYWPNADSPRIGFLFDGIEPMHIPALKDDSIFIDLSERLNIEFSPLPNDHPTQRVGLFTF